MKKFPIGAASCRRLVITIIFLSSLFSLYHNARYFLTGQLNSTSANIALVLPVSTDQSPVWLVYEKNKIFVRNAYFDSRRNWPSIKFLAYKHHNFDCGGKLHCLAYAPNGQLLDVAVPTNCTLFDVASRAEEYGAYFISCPPMRKPAYMSINILNNKDWPKAMYAVSYPVKKVGRKCNFYN